jgi:DNA (cytosine-5)-methyltransferase 1
VPFEHKDERAFADALGCEWMTARGGRQAIPPAYTQFIGELMLEELRERAA